MWVEAAVTDKVELKEAEPVVPPSNEIWMAIDQHAKYHIDLPDFLEVDKGATVLTICKARLNGVVGLGNCKGVLLNAIITGLWLLAG